LIHLSLPASRPSLSPSSLQLVSQYLHLGANLKRCSAAVEAYAHALNEAGDTKEIIDLLRAPLSTPMPTGMPEYLPFLHAGGNDNNKRSKSEDESEVELDANGKKKRVKKAKKLKDPDAPKRPPSAYIFFQNEVREHVKANNPGVPYNEILQQISEQWKALGEEKQKAFKDRADSAMATFRDKNADYVAKGKEALGDASMAVDPTEAAAIQAALTAKPKKEKKSAVAATATAAPASTSGTAAAPAKKETKAAAAKREKKEGAAAAAKPKSAAVPAATSTPAGKNAPLPKPASVPAKKNAPQTTEETSSDDSSSSGDDSSSDDE